MSPKSSKNGAYENHMQLVSSPSHSWAKATSFSCTGKTTPKSHPSGKHRKTKGLTRTFFSSRSETPAEWILAASPLQMVPCQGQSSFTVAHSGTGRLPGAKAQEPRSVEEETITAAGLLGKGSSFEDKS